MNTFIADQEGDGNVGGVVGADGDMNEVYVQQFGSANLFIAQSLSGNENLVDVYQDGSSNEFLIQPIQGDVNEIAVNQEGNTNVVEAATGMVGNYNAVDTNQKVITTTPYLRLGVMITSSKWINAAMTTLLSLNLMALSTISTSPAAVTRTLTVLP